MADSKMSHEHDWRLEETVITDDDQVVLIFYCDEVPLCYATRIGVGDVRFAKPNSILVKNRSGRLSTKIHVPKTPVHKDACPCFCHLPYERLNCGVLTQAYYVHEEEYCGEANDSPGCTRCSVCEIFVVSESEKNHRHDKFIDEMCCEEEQAEAL